MAGQSGASWATDMDIHQEKEKGPVGGNNNSLPSEVSTDELELLKKLEEANRWGGVECESEGDVNVIVILSPGQISVGHCHTVSAIIQGTLWDCDPSVWIVTTSN